MRENEPKFRPGRKVARSSFSSSEDVLNEPGSADSNLRKVAVMGDMAAEIGLG